MRYTSKTSNKLTYIPTELNYFTLMNKRLKTLRKQGNTSRLLIIALIIWNITLTCQYIPSNSAQPIEMQDKQNITEEFAPPYNLEPIKE